MTSGQLVKLERATLALCDVNGKERAVTIPIGDVVEVVVSEPGKDMVHVRWNGQVVTMFAVDLAGRGAEVADQADSSDRNASA
jgi:hypothetical protein